jgi:hypothetical protein
MTKWIEWNGGICPIKSDLTWVEYKCRHGYVERARGVDVRWQNNPEFGVYNYVIAYRIIEDHEPMAYIPLNEKLGHPLLDVFNAGCAARDAGRGTSGYPGNSLEHVIHAAGWVQRDLRLALDKLQGKEPMAQTREQITAQIEALQKQLAAMPVVKRMWFDGSVAWSQKNTPSHATNYFDIETINGVPHIHGVAIKEVVK